MDELPLFRKKIQWHIDQFTYTESAKRRFLHFSQSIILLGEFFPSKKKENRSSRNELYEFTMYWENAFSDVIFLRLIRHVLVHNPYFISFDEVFFEKTMFDKSRMVNFFNNPKEAIDTLMWSNIASAKMKRERPSISNSFVNKSDLKGSLLKLSFGKGDNMYLAWSLKKLEDNKLYWKDMVHHAINPIKIKKIKIHKTSDVAMFIMMKIVNKVFEDYEEFKKLK